MKRIEQIRSKKHPGAVFLKEKGGDFICKIYEGQDEFVESVCQALEAKLARNEGEGEEGLDNEY